MSHFKYLFEPLKINSMELKNRIVMCPMGTNLADESGMPTDHMAAWYGERAKGGTGLVIVEQTVVQPVGKWSKLAAGLWDDKFVAGWKKVVDAVHAHDGKIAIQIGHLGRSTDLENTGGLQPVAPSPVPCHLSQVIPHELTTEEVYQFIDDYLLAVKRAVDAGFDAVQIHGTHGYLIASFMSGKSNKRTDEFGGNLRGRMRLPIEIIRRVRKEVGDDYPVLMRIASVEPKGGRLLEETKVIAGMLAREGIDALDVSAGSFSELEWEIPPYFFAPGFNLMNIAEIKQSVDIPVICSGLVHEPDMADQIIREGRSDMVGVGRAVIADPYWANKASEGLFDEIRYCIACTGCIDVLFVGNPVRCTVNPFAGREAESDIRPADKKKKVVVIGGGPAGLQVASIASARGHEVTLLEKHTMLGGQVRAAAIPPDKYLMAGIIRTLEVEAVKNGAVIRLGEEATPEVIRELNPDSVVVATGARPVIPDFARNDLNNVVTAEDVLLGRVDTGSEVLVLGGGEVGCETAHFLAEYGKSVTIVEMADDIGIEVGFIPRPLLLGKLKLLGVKMLDSTKVDEILNDCVIVEQDGTKQKMAGFDNIVLALGYASVNDLYDQIKELVAETYLVGDARTPGNVMVTLRDAVDIASQL
ncbi:MAG: FAD-dependent oxidoreductase [Nitrospina sp.]|jgi:2,4-dienoyl-CoA reductase-like NADH-dependent reductase (Old Yellow Enzyme family)/thioredoxin reductase|nr:FAD-dependent oxidoreductase [Nitrospina sp.]